jgi:uncharacterized protein (DUF2141 family)
MVLQSRQVLAFRHKPKGDAMKASRFRPTSRNAVSPALLAMAGAAFGLVLLGGAPLGRAETQEDACTLNTPETIKITVEKVRNSKGLITAVLYADNPETFLKNGARIDRTRVEARQGETTLCLHAPAAGRYSVALYHDENGNKKLDQDFLGIPIEGYGFSQNPGFRFGKPDLEETLFTIEGAPVSLHISILYLQG